MGITKTHKYGIERDVSVASDKHTRHQPNAKLLSGMLAILSMLAAAPGHAQTLPYSENFTTTTFRDGTAGQTTADWSGTGQLLLPVSPSLTGVTFDPTTVVEVLPGDFITRAVELADLDGDGDLDLIEGVNGTNGVYLNDGTGNFGVARAYTSPIDSNTRGLAVGDVDRDGDIDFVAGNRSDRIRLYLNDGTGTVFTPQDVTTRGRKTQSVALEDLDGDGFLDVIAANLEFEQNFVYWNTGDPLTPFGLGGSAGVALDSAIQEESRRVFTGDLDNDGDVDFVFMNESEANPNDGGRRQRNRVYMNRLAQGFPRMFDHAEIEPTGTNDIDNSHGGALGDLNNDRFLDLVVVNSSEGETSKIYLNNASGTPNANPFTIGATSFTTGGPSSDPAFARTATLADADHDGDLDIFMVIAGHDFRNRVYFNDGTGVIMGFNDVGQIGQLPLVLGDPADVGPVSLDGAVGDVDGDGDLDWVLGNQETKPTTGAMENILLRNTGDALGTPVQQLRARATSLLIDNTAGVTSVRLNPLPLTTNVGTELHTGIDYWVSGNGGANWSPIAADGRPVPIVGGTDVRWRAVLRANTPANAGTMALDQLDIAANSTGPVLGTPIGPRTVVEGDDLSGAPAITADFTDADGDTIYHSLMSGLPDGTGIGIDPLSGTLIGTPSNADSVATPIIVTVRATDGAFADTDTFTLTVTNSNDGPNIDSLPPDLNPGPPATSGATQDVLYTYAIAASDPDVGDTALLVFETLSKPDWLILIDNFNGTATLSGTPSAADVFSPDNLVELVVRDPAGATDQQTFAMAIQNVNDAPSFTSAPVTAATQDVSYSYSVITNDPDVGDALTITAPVLPAWMTFNDNGDGTATLSGTPGNIQVGDHTVQLAVTDPTGPAVTQDFTVSVANVNDAPSFTSTPVIVATQGATYSYAIATTDPDVDVLTITAPTLPAWLTLTDNGDGTASLSGTPGGADVGDHAVQLAVSDGALTVTQDFTITVGNVNDAPTFTSAAVTAATQDVLYTYTVTTNDLDGDAVTITAPTLPAWLSLVDNGDGTATLSGTPDLLEVGDHAVQLAVSDGGPAVTQDFTVSVADVNDAPVFTSIALTAATEGVAYSYTITIVDPDLDAVTITAPTLPAWLTFADNGDGTATLTGTPTGAEVGDSAVEIQAQEDAPAPGLVTSQAFVITVTAAADGPVITLVGNASITITAGNAYNDQGATATDPQDGDLTAQIVTDNPVNINIAATYTVTYTVMDSAGNSAQAQRTVIVQAAPPPPPPPSGGGSMGLAELSIFAMFLVAFGVRRRRYTRIRVP